MSRHMSVEEAILLLHIRANILELDYWLGNLDKWVRSNFTSKINGR